MKAKATGRVKKKATKITRMKKTKKTRAALDCLPKKAESRSLLDVSKKLGVLAG